MRTKKNFGWKATVLLQLAFGSMVTMSCVGAFGAANATDGAWHEAYKVRSRLVAGHVGEGATASPVAFVQIEMEPGWKTYWRNPGEAGGIPPEFDWTDSKNLSEANVLFPAPKRLVDPIGDTVGYKDGVIFPVRIAAKDAKKPVVLNLNLKFGICKEICVPSEAKLNVEVPQRGTQSLAGHLAQVLEQVPRPQAQLSKSDPMLQTVKAPTRDGDTWRIGFLTKHTTDARGADLFLEAPAGIFVPTPKRTSTAKAPMASFQIKVSQSEYKDLRGKTLRATVVDDNGASEAEFVLR